MSSKPEIFEFVINSEDELTTVVQAVLALVRSRSRYSIGLRGPLGTGKTTFVRYLTHALGSADSVTSPTYVLEHLYAAENGSVISHWDLYRLQGGVPEELLFEPDSNTLRVIEWSDKFPELESRLDMVVSFERLSENSRRILMTAK